MARSIARSMGFCATVLALTGMFGPRSSADERDAGVKDAGAKDAAVDAGKSATSSRSSALPPIDLRGILPLGRREGGQWVAHDASGRRIELTLSPNLQERARRLFQEYQVPYAALVAIEPSTGRILAYVSHSSSPANTEDLARDVTPPAASVFKLITSSALIDGGVTPDTRVCYSGGSSRLNAGHLQDNPRRDHACATLDEALGKSLNAVFAKLADKHLNASTLLRYAKSFGFGQALPFEFAPPPSPIEVPGERLEFARTAAGFWHVFMSPLHAALIAATFANDGSMPRPRLIERVVLPDGKLAPALSPGPAPRAVLSPKTAQTVSKMMLRTVKDGTSRAAFLDGRGRSQLPGIQVAGKTGSLSAGDPYRAYSWWVGFAPAEQPRIALAALIVNGPVWRIKSSFVAREVLREYLLGKPGEPAQVARKR
jgi:peptidoglycan glycosyltransferase